MKYVLDNDDSSHWFDIVVRETVGGATTELGTQRIVTTTFRQLSGLLRTSGSWNGSRIW